MNSTLKAFGHRPACAGCYVGAGRRLARSASRGRFPIGVRGQRPARVSEEFDLKRPSPAVVSNEFDLIGLRPMAGLRRPKMPSASAQADARRGAPMEADFQSA